MVVVAGVCFTLLPGPCAWAQRKRPLRQFELNAALEKFAGDFGFTAGPGWDDRGFLDVGDPVRNKIFRVFPGGSKEEVLSLGDPHPSAFDRNHRLIGAAGLPRAIIAVEADGNYRVLADNYNGRKFNRPNDVTLGPGGGWQPPRRIPSCPTCWMK